MAFNFSSLTMTREQLYAEYLTWLNGETSLDLNQLFRFPLTNRDISEDDTSVVNRLYFVVPHFSQKTLRLFAFFEENYFTKDVNGDLRLSHSAFYIQH